jgi:hypothetical protein
MGGGYYSHIFYSATKKKIEVTSACNHTVSLYSNTECLQSHKQLIKQLISNGTLEWVIKTSKMRMWPKSFPYMCCVQNIWIYQFPIYSHLLVNSSPTRIALTIYWITWHFLTNAQLPLCCHMKYAENSIPPKLVPFWRHSTNVKGDKNESVSVLVMCITTYTACYSYKYLNRYLCWSSMVGLNTWHLLVEHVRLSKVKVHINFCVA